MDVSSTSGLASATLVRTIAELRDRIATVAEEAATGRHADQAKQLDGRVGDAMLAQKALDDLALQRSQLALRGNRQAIIQDSLSTIANGIDGLGPTLLAGIGLGADAAVELTAADARAALDDMLQALTARHGERHLFSGDATADAPFAGSDALIADIAQIASTALDPADFATQVDTYFQDPLGGWRQSIYQGAQTASDPEALTGVEPALTEIVAALSVMSLGALAAPPGLTENNPSILAGAAEDLIAGQTSLTELQAERGRLQAGIDADAASLDIQETILTDAFNALTARDPFEAATELRELERNLEAAYLLTTRLANLSLTNFLR